MNNMLLVEWKQEYEATRDRRRVGIYVVTTLRTKRPSCLIGWWAEAWERPGFWLDRIWGARFLARLKYCDDVIFKPGSQETVQ